MLFETSVRNINYTRRDDNNVSDSPVFIVLKQTVSFPVLYAVRCVCVCVCFHL